MAYLYAYLPTSIANFIEEIVITIFFSKTFLFMSTGFICFLICSFFCHKANDNNKNIEIRKLFYIAIIGFIICAILVFFEPLQAFITGLWLAYFLSCQILGIEKTIGHNLFVVILSSLKPPNYVDKEIEEIEQKNKTKGKEGNEK